MSDATIGMLAASPIYERRINECHLLDIFRLAGHALVHQLPMLCSSQRLGTASRVVRRTAGKGDQQNRGDQYDGFHAWFLSLGLMPCSRETADEVSNGF